jgi:hypothetical protein
MAGLVPAMMKAATRLTVPREMPGPRLGATIWRSNLTGSRFRKIFVIASQAKQCRREYSDGIFCHDLAPMRFALALGREPGYPTSVMVSNIVLRGTE